MSQLSISLLGPFQATLDGEPIDSFESNKARALLIYLAMEAAQVHRREHLADILWPELPGRGALSNLRYTLSNLRQAIGDRQAKPPFLLITRDTILFNVDSDYQIDVTTFRHLISADSQIDEIERLEQALALYRGSFLEGFSVRDSAPFEEWALFKREEIGRQVMAALRRLATLHEQQGEYERAITHTRRQLELEPWQEEAHRQLMHLLALTGERSAALAQYHTCLSQLEAELGVEPTAETTALYVAIRDGTLTRARPQQVRRTQALPAVPPALQRAPTAPFVAREQEMARLGQALELARTGQGQAIFVIGEAGSGKTALIQQFALRAMATYDDVLPITGNCAAHDGAGDPYLPFMDALQMLAGDIEAKRAGGAITPEHARRLWRSLPQMVQALVDAGPDLIGLLIPGQALATRVSTFAPWPGGAAARARSQARLEELARHRPDAPGTPVAMPQPGLFTQVTRVFQTLAWQQTLILVLDDLQWVDSGSIDLLFHLGRRLAGSRLLIVGAYRPGSVALGRQGERHPLEFLVNEFQRDFGNEPIDLAQADGRQFVEALVDTEPNRLGAAFRQTIYHHTHGHALFTVELLRGLQKRGDLVQDNAGRWTEGPDLDWDRLPARVEAVIAEQVDRLPPECQATLAVASVEGEEFIAEVVARVQGQPEPEILQRLSGELGKQHDLVRAQSLQRLAPGGPGSPQNGQRLSRYRFRHYLFQKYLYHRLDPVERANLHEAIGYALEAMFAGQDAEKEAIAPQLARHFEAAGLVGKAVDYLTLAGRRAFRLSAIREAITFYRRGLSLLESGADRAEADGYGLGRLDREHERREFDLQLALGDPLLVAEGWGGPEQNRALMRAYQLAERLDEIDHLVPVLLSVARMSTGQGEFHKSLDLAREILPLAREAGEPFYLAMCHQRLGWNYMFLGQLDASRQHLEQALDLCRRYESGSAFPQATWIREIRIPALIWQPYTLWVLGYPDQAWEKSQEALAQARELDHAATLVGALSAAGSGFCLAARLFDAAREHTTVLLRLSAGKEMSTFETLEIIHEGYERVQSGQIEVGIEQMRRALAAVLATGQLATLPRQTILLADAYRQAGRAGLALDTLDEAKALIDETGASSSLAEVYRLRGEVLQLQAARRKTQAETRGHRSRGAEQDDLSQAEAWFRQAIDLARQQRARSWELRATISLSRLLQQRGQACQAHDLLAEIYGWFQEGFDTPDLQDARALLQELAEG